MNSIDGLDQFGRVELHPDRACILPRAARRLRRVQRAGQRRALVPRRPDEGADRAGPRLIAGRAAVGGDRPENLEALRDAAEQGGHGGGLAGDRRHPHRGREPELGAVG